MEDRLDWRTASQAMGELSGQVAQLHAQMIQTAARVIEDEAWVGSGIRSVEHFLELKTGLDRGTVGKLVKVARRVGELPELMDLLREGRVTLDQAAVVARHVPASHSKDAAEFSEHATVTQLRRGLSGWFHETNRGGAAEPRGGEASVQVTHLDDRFRLTFTTGDLVAGALVEQAIREAKDTLFTAGNAEATLADGLVEVANRSLSTVGDGSRRGRFQVLMHLDTEGQSWLHKRGALPQYLADRYTCEGQIVPVWETEGTAVAVGRSQRIVPDRVRRLIEDRDKGCRYPGCHSMGYLEVHHQVHWRDGGATDPSNLLCLCTFHHDEHHREKYAIEGDPQRVDGLVFRSHYGWVINPKRPQPPPYSGGDRPNWRGPTGEPLQTRWLSFRPNAGSDPPPVLSARESASGAA